MAAPGSSIDEVMRRNDEYMAEERQKVLDPAAEAAALRDMFEGAGVPMPHTHVEIDQAVNEYHLDHVNALPRAGPSRDLVHSACTRTLDGDRWNEVRDSWQRWSGKVRS